MIYFLTYLLNLFDLFMTNLFISRYGVEVEANPIMRWAYEHNMAGAVKIFVMGGILAVLGLLLRKYPKYAWTAYIPLVAYGLLAIYHIICLGIVF